MAKTQYAYRFCAIMIQECKEGLQVMRKHVARRADPLISPRARAVLGDSVLAGATAGAGVHFLDVRPHVLALALGACAAGLVLATARWRYVPPGTEEGNGGDDDNNMPGTP